MAHVCQFLTSWTNRTPSTVLTVCQGSAKTAEEVLFRIACLSRALIDEHGLGRGDRVAIVARNTDLFFEAFMAVLAAGAIAVPVNLRWSLSEAEGAIESVGAQIALIDDDVATFGGLKQRPGLWCISLGASNPSIATGLHNSSGCSQTGDVDAVRALDLHTGPGGAAMICFTSGTAGAPKGAVLSHTALHAQALTKLIAVGYRRDDVYLHCAPLYHIGGISSMLAVLAAGATQVFQPVFSAASTLDLIAAHNVTAFIAVPAMVVSLAQAPQSAAAAQLDAWKSSHGHASSSIDPTAYRAVSSAHSPTGRSPGSALTCVQRILLGGGELPEHLQRRLCILFPCAFCTTAYGMTEACSSITFRPMQAEAPCPSRICPGTPTATGGSASEREPRAAAAEGICVGEPPPGIEVAVLCSAASAEESCEGGAGEAEQLLRGITAAPEAVGEVVTRGPHVMLGYWNNPGASARAFLPGGWLRTGDLGRLDAGGALWLLGRLKDVVRSGSENINAAAVEHVLLQLPGVAGAAVVGLPHERLGEQVSALLMLHADVEWRGGGMHSSIAIRDNESDESSRTPSNRLVLSSDRIVSMCRQKGLSSFMVPRTIVAQYEALPTNSSGKPETEGIAEVEVPSAEVKAKKLARQASESPSPKFGCEEGVEMGPFWLGTDDGASVASFSLGYRTSRGSDEGLCTSDEDAGTGLKRARSPSTDEEEAAGGNHSSGPEPTADTVYSEDDFKDELLRERCREDNFYTTPHYLKTVLERRALHIKVFQYDDDEFVAVAPEWIMAAGDGETAEAAKEDLQLKMRSLKERAVNEKLVAMLSNIPVEPSKEKAERWCRFHSRMINDHTRYATHVSWDKIVV